MVAVAKKTDTAAKQTDYQLKNPVVDGINGNSLGPLGARVLLVL